MADVDTEQKATFASPQSTDSAASVAVIEENLAALLKAVSGPLEIVAPVKIVAPAELPPPVSSVKIEPAHPAPEPAIPYAGPALAVEFERAAPAEIPAAPHESGTSEAPAQEQSPPVVESQQEVVSKLALLSSIKQRRAVSAMNTGVRTDFASASGVESTLPTNPASPAEPAAQAVAPAKEHPVQEQRERKTEIAKTGLPVEKNRPTDAQDNARPTDAVPPPDLSMRPSTRSANILFSPVEETSSAEPKSFATSGAGMTTIGGSIVAVGLIGYLLIGHGTKPPVGPAKAISTEPVQTVATRTPAAVPSVVKTPAAAAKTPPAVATIPPSAGKKDEKTTPQPSGAQTANPAVLPPPTSSSPANSTPPASSTPPPAAEINSAPAARAFTPPAAGARPQADTTIREAPPALSAATPAVPTVTALPAGIAPPPAAVPQSNAAKASGPHEISVPGKVQASKLARSVTPAYPSLAKTTRVQGTVRFRITIATDGRVTGLMLMGGPAPLVQAAADAVRQWRYQPTVVNGEAVEVITEVEVAFKL